MFLHVLRVEGAFVQLHLLLLLPLGQALQVQRVQILAQFPAPPASPASAAFAWPGPKGQRVQILY